MAAKKTYWPELFRLLRILCRYYNAHADKLPTDLPNEVKVALEAVRAACAVLAAYDASHAGGLIV